VSVRADVGVIGGSGLYRLLDGADEVTVDTPYGPPSDPITVADVGGRRVAFLPRHGRDHRFPPHRIPYRANLWALRELGVRQVLAPCAVGGLRPELGPGTFVLPDQLVDRTSGRVQTFYDQGAVHVGFADPYCPTGRSVVREVAGRTGFDVVPTGTMVVIEGPRFSTRAESRWYTALGGTVVNMTGYPEAVLARELALCYTSLALVTDLDAGVEGDHGVTQDEVFTVFADNTERLRTLLLDVAAALPVDGDCSCHHALDGIDVPHQAGSWPSPPGPGDL
jgi:5'-methylthioadenosine phosphorylase